MDAFLYRTVEPLGAAILYSVSQFMVKIIKYLIIWPTPQHSFIYKQGPNSEPKASSYPGGIEYESSRLSWFSFI